MTQTSLSVRPEDRPLHDDVRWLAAKLGEVVRRVEGDRCFHAVEELRAACRARRRGEPGAPGLSELLERVDALPLDTVSRVARAFASFFLLINTAEQVHRVRRRRDYRKKGAGAQPGSPEWALAKLAKQGRTASEVRQVIAQVEVRPVLTAHPTESTRRTILTQQARVAAALLARDDAGQEDRARHDADLESEIELLWVTSEVRKTRPTVYDEIATATWYLEDRLLLADGLADREIARAFEKVFGENLGVAVPLTLGTWVGGDRDGNPMVTPEVTVAAARRASRSVVTYYLREVRELIERLALSDSITPTGSELRASIERDRAELPQVWEANHRRDADEPLRMKLSFIAARLEARIQELEGHASGRGPRIAYLRPEALLADLELVRGELVRASAQRTMETLLAPLLDQIAKLGFHGMRLDAREDAGAHQAALNALTTALQAPPLDGAALRRELLGRRPLLGTQLHLPEDAEKTVETFRAIAAIQQELGEQACQTYIISMAKTAEDLLRVLLLAREVGLVELSRDPPRSALDVVPLFETLGDLEAAPGVLSELLADPVFQRQLDARGRKLEIMIGYSDSAKDAGVLPASWALYRAQEELAARASAASVALTLFHGRGGTVGRGGGSPVYRALTALPPGSIGPGIKITEQGEVVSQKFGILEIAERSLEVMLSGAWMASFEDWRRDLLPGEEGRFRQVMEQLSAAALPVFRRWVHEEPAAFRMLSDVTPLQALAHVHYGSRPAYRNKGAGTMAGIRAIPWGFGWTQIRLMLPSWLGVGTALAGVMAEPGGTETLRRMARVWPFFEDLLGKVEMVLAKSDLEIARLYVESLGGDLKFFAELEAELKRAIRAVLEIREKSSLLQGEMLATTIALRNPYVDPLSLLQVSLLRRQRALPEDEQNDERLAAPLASTINGIAQGMRNTG